MADGVATDFRRRKIPVDGPRGTGFIAAVEFGRAAACPDVLFLHANGFNAMTYRQILAPLAPDIAVTAIDLRGHGHSTLPTIEAGHDWLVHRDDLLAVIDAVGLPGVLAGHSIGATTCLLAAAELGPSAPLRLVLFDPVLRGDRAGTGRMDWEMPLAAGALRRKAVFESREAALASYRGRGAFRSWPDAMLADYLLDGLLEQPDGWFRLACAPRWEAVNFAASYLVDSTGTLQGIRRPVHILAAATQSTADLGSREAEILGSGHVRLERIAGCTHFLPMERPDLVQDALRAAVAAR